MASNPQARVPVSQSSPTPAIREQPFPVRFFDCMMAYKRGAALKAAVELDLFTVLSESSMTPESLALRLQASARGVRILCDFLAVEGLLVKQDGRYSAKPDCAMFLNRKSPMYIGSAVFFLGNPMLMENFRDLAGCVRKGGTVNADGAVAPEHPVWVEFARSMAPIAAMEAESLAQFVSTDPARPVKVLDIAAGHGMYGITLARHNPNVQVVAQDWKNVLTVARENAEKAGVSSRYNLLEGSAFEVDFGNGYDIVLLTNFLHHFNPETNEDLLRKVRRALNPGGRAIAAEFVPDEDRLAPPAAAQFSLMMLASTPDGDAYTFRELESMFLNAGFRSAELHELPLSFQRIVVGS